MTRGEWIAYAVSLGVLAPMTAGLTDGPLWLGIAAGAIWAGALVAQLVLQHRDERRIEARQ